jgi:hypothetical protein
VLSVRLDDWSQAQVAVLEAVGGNDAANALLEYHCPPEHLKPGPQSRREVRSKFIRQKYEERVFEKGDGDPRPALPPTSDEVEDDDEEGGEGAEVIDLSLQGMKGAVYEYSV